MECSGRGDCLCGECQCRNVDLFTTREGENGDLFYDVQDSEIEGVATLVLLLLFLHSLFLMIDCCFIFRSSVHKFLVNLVSVITSCVIVTWKDSCVVVTKVTEHTSITC